MASVQKDPNALMDADIEVFNDGTSSLDSNNSCSSIEETAYDSSISSGSTANVFPWDLLQSRKVTIKYVTKPDTGIPVVSRRVCLAEHIW